MVFIDSISNSGSFSHCVRRAVAGVPDFFFGVSTPRTGQPTYWELVRLKGTNSWQSYVRMARERGWKLVLLVQAYAKPTPPSAAEQEGGADAEEEVGDSSSTARRSGT